jgi:hypothetical protein
MNLFDWAVLIIGVGLIISGVRAIYWRQADVPEKYEGSRAVSLS